MARTGWFKQVRIKAEATQLDRARLKIREQLVISRGDGGPAAGTAEAVRPSPRPGDDARQALRAAAGAVRPAAGMSIDGGVGGIVY
jgi:hypothetical protein